MSVYAAPLSQLPRTWDCRSSTLTEVMSESPQKMLVISAILTDT